jgi:protein phosphatase
MGTTLTMAYCLGADLFIAHVGDSRCYLYRGGILHQLTNDHTLVAEMIRTGAIPPEQASRHQLRHVITNVIGGHEPGVQVEVHKVRTAPGDRLLLCSDGLTEMLPDEQIGAVLEEGLEPRPTCERLVKAANDRGGKDNITVVVADFDVPG